jgi:hypothetical protein
LVLSGTPLENRIEELKRRMEVLLGARPEAAEDESMKALAEKEAAVLAKKEKVAAAGGRMVSAAFAFMSQIFADDDNDAEIDRLAGAFKANLGDCLEKMR